MKQDETTAGQKECVGKTTFCQNDKFNERKSSNQNLNISATSANKKLQLLQICPNLSKNKKSRKVRK